MLFSLSAVVLFALVLAAEPIANQANNESLARTRSLDTVYPVSWVSDLFYQALANFTVRNVGSTACQKQAKMYDEHLRNYTSWAVRSKYPFYEHNAHTSPYFI